MKGDQQVAWFVVIAVSGGIVGHIMGAQALPSGDAWSQLLAASIGAFVGAFSAFSLENVRRKHADSERDADSAHRILLDLQSMHLELSIYSDQILGKVADKPDDTHWIQLQAIYVEPDVGDMLNTSLVSFMLPTDGANLVAQVHLNRKRYYLDRHSIKQHFAMRATALSRIEQHGVAGKFHNETWQRVVGPVLYSDLKGVVERLRFTVDRDRKDCARLFVELRKWLVARFPKHQFIDARSEKFLRDASEGQLPLRS